MLFTDHQRCVSDLAQARLRPKPLHKLSIMSAAFSANWDIHKLHAVPRAIEYIYIRNLGAQGQLPRA